MKVQSLDFKTAEKALGVELIANGRGTQALFDTVTAQQANRRQGTRSTKTKAEVAGTGKKPFRQKGTGHARQGYTTAVIHRGGGVVFGPKPQDFSKKVPRKVRKLALKKAVSELAKGGRLHSVDALDLKEPRTKVLTGELKANKVEQNALLVTSGVRPNVFLAARNLPKVDVKEVSEVSVEDLIRFENVLLAEEAIEALGKRMK